jgi:phosphodiesterase/alkaline phosphatase D-like protein
MTPVDPSFFQRLDAFLRLEVGPWLDEIRRGVQSGDLPADSAIVGTWPLPEFEDVASVDATVDGDRTTVTISLQRTGQVIATTTTARGPR